MDIHHMDTVYRFGGLSLDLARGALLTVGGEVIPLRPKSFALLVLFVANAGKLLSRDAINQAIWSDVIVTDDGITQCVRDIRRALGDSTQQMLRTVPRRGFIFSAEVVAESKATNADTAASRDKPSVAVLPFANMSGQPEQEYFSDGVADDIITNLSGSSSLLVTARTSSFAYRGRPIDVKQVAHDDVLQFPRERECDHAWRQKKRWTGHDRLYDDLPSGSPGCRQTRALTPA